MSYLIQHSQKKYVNKNCSRGFCDDLESATKFKSIFEGMRYLNKTLHEETIEEYKFIDTSTIRQVRQNAKNNTNGRRWRTN